MRVTVEKAVFEYLHEVDSGEQSCDLLLVYPGSGHPADVGDFNPLDIAKVYIVQDEQLNQTEEDVQENLGAQAPTLEDQIEGINPTVQEGADLKSSSARIKNQSSADIRQTVAKARRIGGAG